MDIVIDYSPVLWRLFALLVGWQIFVKQVEVFRVVLLISSEKLNEIGGNCGLV